MKKFLFDLFPLLLVAATLGVLSPSGNEVGPFLAIEQASLAQLVEDRKRTSLFARYQVAGSIATAAGSLAAGVVTQSAMDAGLDPVDAFRTVIVGYAAIGLLMALAFPLLSAAVEVPETRQTLQRLLANLGQPFLALRIGVRAEHDEPPPTPRLPTEQTIEIVP